MSYIYAKIDKNISFVSLAQTGFKFYLNNEIIINSKNIFPKASSQQMI